jgi:hypothetical protein
MRKAYDLSYWDAVKIKDAVVYARDLGKPKSMRMAALDFVDLRKFASDVIDINTKAGDLRLGLMGVMYGMSVYVDRSRVQGVVSLFGPDEVALSHVVNPRRWSDKFFEEGHSLSFHPGEFASCPDELCLSMLVMGS